MMEDKIVCHLNAYYDDELIATQYVTKMQKLEKALDKACKVLVNRVNVDGTPAFTLTKEQWKEWCMKDV